MRSTSSSCSGVNRTPRLKVNPFRIPLFEADLCFSLRPASDGVTPVLLGRAPCLSDARCCIRVQFFVVGKPSFYTGFQLGCHRRGIGVVLSANSAPVGDFDRGTLVRPPCENREVRDWEIVRNELFPDRKSNSTTWNVRSRAAQDGHATCGVSDSSMTSRQTVGAEGRRVDRTFRRFATQ
jgi:hypothetical protein